MVFFGRFCRVRKRAPSSSGARMDSRPKLDVSSMAPKSSTAKDPDIHKVERLQVPYSTTEPAFDSDVVAETLTALDIPYSALNPDASYRGVHTSIRHCHGNARPRTISCRHAASSL